MAILQTVRDAWRKNAPELVGLFDGSLPAFVTAPRTVERLVGVPVFCYHLVTADGLRRDLEFLRRNCYVTLAAGELLANLDEERPVASRAVVLTFDDGPRNFHDVAFPLLQEFGARATAFVAPGLHADDDPADEAPDRPMSWQELRVVHASGLVDLESHTFESRYVPRWPAPAALAGCAPALEARRRSAIAYALEEDLLRSRTALAQHVPGCTVRHLSFPLYTGTEEAVEVARALGFQACYWGYRPGHPLNVAGQSPFHISRISDEFVQRLPGDGRITPFALVAERVRRIKAVHATAARHGRVGSRFDCNTR
jgi:peptidoglycan/xylan/chitin deacetylase (PgdA/CDA1 family)